MAAIKRKRRNRRKAAAAWWRRNSLNLYNGSNNENENGGASKINNVAKMAKIKAAQQQHISSIVSCISEGDDMAISINVS